MRPNGSAFVGSVCHWCGRQMIGIVAYAKLQPDEVDCYCRATNCQDLRNVRKALTDVKKLLKEALDALQERTKEIA